MDRFQLMFAFTRAVETGSFSAVARELGSSQPQVSRGMAALELQLGTRLMHRSTRKLTLTPEGERYYEEARQILDAVAQAEANARGEDQLGGQLRVTCPTSLGTSMLVPWVGELLRRYPALALDLQISDQYVDLVEGGVDLALRVGTLRDSALKARRIGVSERVCVASPAYLARHPEPRVPADLRQHECIVFTLLAGGSWGFRDGAVAVSGRFKVNSTDGIQHAVMAGMGIGFGPLWQFEAAIRDGRLRMLLTDFGGPPTPMQVVYSAQRLLPRRASVFMDFLADKFAATPALNEGARERLVADLAGAKKPRQR